jgi:ABC-type polysaccharide/polyol phosphate export permease
MRLIEHFRELWRYRTLIGSLVRRDVAMRYRGSVLGYLWTMLNPLMLLAVYNLVFSQIMRAVSLPHYALFLFVGLLPWLWLSGSLNNGALSIANGGSLITSCSRCRWRWGGRPWSGSRRPPRSSPCRWRCRRPCCSCTD